MPICLCPDAVTRLRNIVASFPQASDADVITTAAGAWVDLVADHETVCKLVDTLDDDLPLVREARAEVQAGGEGLPSDAAAAVGELADLLATGNLLSHRGAIKQLTTKVQDARRHAATEAAAQHHQPSLTMRAPTIRARFAEMDSGKVDEALRQLEQLAPPDEPTTVPLGDLLARVELVEPRAASTARVLEELQAAGNLARVRVMELVSEPITTEEELDIALDRIRQAAVAELARRRQASAAAMTVTASPAGLDAAQRTQLERLVTRARAALEADLGAQAEGRFGIHADGTIEDEQALPDDASDRATRRDLVEIIDHICSLGESQADAVARLLREAAFTHLNRLLAIRIAEAIGLLPESLANGRQSRGFKDLGEIMPILGDDYWGYLLLCGDELAADAPALFDPRNPLLALAPSTAGARRDRRVTGRRRATAELWLAPDTLGWAYQFFNTADERRLMREEAAAPRNLARTRGAQSVLHARATSSTSWCRTRSAGG